MKKYLLMLGLLSGSCAVTAAHSGYLSYNDVQLCTNAYNHLWYTFETVKSDQRGNPAAQGPIFTTEFTKILATNFHFEVLKLPIPPNFDTTIDIVLDGIPTLVQVAQSIDNYGEHHVATPFSVKLQESGLGSGMRVYKMTTRDVDYTRDAVTEGGCTVYLSQKDVVCTVTNNGPHGRKGILNSLVDNVVTSYRIPAPQCGLWIAAPVTPYV